MFCSKCGTQAPDGAMFCSSCGNQLITQPVAPAMPTAPVMPVEPIAPVMDTPVMEAPIVETPITDAPIMDAPVVETPIMDAPIVETPAMEAPIVETPAMEAPVTEVPFMPVAEPVLTTPAFMPTEPTLTNSASNNNTPKKSKAPLFIGLGIAGLVIAIVTIVLILIFTKDDDKKKDKAKNKSTSAATTTEGSTENETSTEDTTTKPDSGTTETDADIDDAEDMVVKFMKALKASNFSKASNYLLPSLLEALEDQSYLEPDDVTEELATIFSDLDGDVLEYEITDVYFDSSDVFDEIADILMDYPSYEEPTKFATAEIMFSYENQSSYFYFDLAYVDGEWYIIEYDDDDFYIDLGTETETDPDTDTPSGEIKDFDTSLVENVIYYPNDLEGTLTDFDDYTITIPSDWTYEDDMIVDSAVQNAVQIEAISLNGQSTEDYLKGLYDMCLEENCTYFELGNLILDESTGYYLDIEYQDSYQIFAVIIIDSAKGIAYEVTAMSTNSNSNNFKIATAIAASFELK